MTQTQIHMLADATHTRCIEDEKDDTYHQIYRAYVYELRNALPDCDYRQQLDAWLASDDPWLLIRTLERIMIAYPVVGLYE